MYVHICSNIIIYAWWHHVYIDDRQKLFIQLFIVYTKPILQLRISVFTDHNDPTYKCINTERVMRWRLILEEFSPELIYIKGSKNIVADACSQLDRIERLDYTNSNNYNKVQPALDSLSENFAFNKEDVLHPISFKTIMRFQQMDKSLIEIAKEKVRGILLSVDTGIM